ncbi:hypothetical protein ES705_28455 [subsurface metagenome]
MRAFVIEVSPENTKPLTKFAFIIPRLVKTHNLENLSRLSVKPKCFFNEEGRTTGEIKVINKNRIIFDGFDCQVDHNHGIKPHFSDKATRIEFDLRNKPIFPGERELFRLRFDVDNLIDKRPSVSTFNFSYFAIEECKEDIFLELSHTYDIMPVVPIYKMETRQGGFDILVYAPPYKELGSPVDKYGHVSIKYDYKAKPLNKRLNGVRWHLREIIDSPLKEIIFIKNKGFTSWKKIQGTIRTPVQFKDIEELKKSTKELKESAKKAKESSGKSRIISIIALIAAIIIPLLLYFLPKILPS